MAENMEIKLESDKIEITINPKMGGCITSFLYKGKKEQFPVLRSIDKKNVDVDGAKASCGFVMVPYSSEIRDGGFIYWGIKRKVDPNDDSYADALNGDGWKKTWNVDESSASSVTMSYSHDGLTGFPYPYSVSQKIEIVGNKVKFTVSVTNNFELPMPVGFGFNPYFNKTPDVMLQLRNRTVWSHEGLISISKPYKTPADWNFEKEKSFDDTEFDTCFGGYDGKLSIRYPSSGIKVELNSEDDFHHAFIYNRTSNDYFVVAPSTNAQDAFNIAAKGVIGSGIKTLEPDEVCSEVFEFTITEE